MPRPLVALVLLGCAVGGGIWKFTELRRFADASSGAIVAESRAEARGPDLRLVLVETLGRAHLAKIPSEPRWDGLTHDDLAAYRRGMETRLRLEAEVRPGLHPTPTQILNSERIGSPPARALARAQCARVRTAFTRFYDESTRNLERLVARPSFSDVRAESARIGEENRRLKEAMLRLVRATEALIGKAEREGYAYDPRAGTSSFRDGGGLAALETSLDAFALAQTGYARLESEVLARRQRALDEAWRRLTASP